MSLQTVHISVHPARTSAREDLPEVAAGLTEHGVNHDGDWRTRSLLLQSWSLSTDLSLLSLFCVLQADAFAVSLKYAAALRGGLIKLQVGSQ